MEDAIQNGLNIKMTMGDEIVEFAPRINNKGEASLNINHRESVNGDCSGTIRNFILKFKDQGIYIKDDLEKETKKLEKNDGNKLLSNKK